MIDPQNFIEHMLEAENLSDYLEDDDADYLINWGVAQLKEKIAKIENTPSAGEFANNLMGFMRTLNQVAGNLENVRQGDLAKLAEYHQKTFGAGRDPAAKDYQEAASRLKAMAPRQAMDYILQWLLP